MAILLLAPTGCREVTEAFVHIDNGEERPINVYVDDVFVAQVNAGHCRRLTLPLGTHQFSVQALANKSTNSRSEILYSQSHTLETGNRPYRTPIYVLNPDGNNRYCEVALTDPDTAAADNGDPIVTLVSHQPATESLDGNENRTKILGENLQNEFNAMLEKTRLYDPRSFFRVDQTNHLFGPFPKSVFKLSTGSGPASAMVRIPIGLHQKLSRVKAVTDPTEADLELLQTATEAASSSISMK
ncbi:hypothetical protein ACMFWY_26590 [Roseiconus sp. JC912]|uniref:hypothetical protein n=1 Tax=Roseiconus sp. JC912 TaxID=3396307 RepID=UPI003A4C6F92